MLALPVLSEPVRNAAARAKLSLPSHLRACAGQDTLPTGGRAGLGAMLASPEKCRAGYGASASAEGVPEAALTPSPRSEVAHG